MNTDKQDCEEGEGEVKIPNSLSAHKNCQILCFSYLVPALKFGSNTERNVKVNPVRYLNQPFLNYTQAEYSLYTFSVTRKLKLSQINIAVKTFVVLI